MAADDIYEVSVHFENPSGNASFRLYYQEAIIRSGIGTDTQILAQSWDTALTPSLRAAISDDWLMSAIVCRKVDPVPEAKFRVDLPAQAGLRTGPGLPANNCLLIGLSQTLFSAKSNGRIFVPGIAEGDTTVGNLTAAYQTGPLLTLVNDLAQQLVEESAGTGRWDLGVVSAKIRDAALPAKDWPGAFSPVGTVTGSPIIATQRRRATKVIGAAL